MDLKVLHTRLLNNLLNMLLNRLGPVFFSKPEAVASEGQDPPPPPGKAAQPNLQVVAYQFCVFLY